jgi:hypothetical protein
MINAISDKLCHIINKIQNYIYCKLMIEEIEERKDRRQIHINLEKEFRYYYCIISPFFLSSIIF